MSWRGEVSNSQLLATGVPQGSVLGPLLFSIYMSSLISVIQKHGFSYHCYADDTQLYFSFQPDDLTVAVHIAACLTGISSWMKDHHLQLNLAKAGRTQDDFQILTIFFKKTWETTDMKTVSTDFLPYNPHPH